MKKLLIGLLALGSISAFAKPISIPTEQLKEYVKAVEIAIEGTIKGGKISRCQYLGNKYFMKSLMVGNGGSFYYKDIYSRVHSGTIDSELENPLINLKATSALENDRFQIIELSVSTMDDLSTVTSYEFREYLSRSVTVNTGTLANPKLETKRVTEPTGAVYVCK